MTPQTLASRGDVDAATRRSVIARHYPEAVDATNRYRNLAEQVSSRIFPRSVGGGIKRSQSAGEVSIPPTFPPTRVFSVWIIY